MPRINSALSSPGRRWKPGTRDKKIFQTEFDYEPDVLTASKLRHAAHQLANVKPQVDIVWTVPPNFVWDLLKEAEDAIANG